MELIDCHRSLCQIKGSPKQGHISTHSGTILYNYDLHRGLKTHIHLRLKIAHM